MRGAVLILLAMLPLAASAQGVKLLSKPKPVGYRAERCRYEARGRRTICTGRVVVTREDLRISCQRLVAELDAAGRISKLSCRDKVEIVTAGRVARSDVARYDAHSDQLVLDGRARVAQGESRLAGETITLDLETGDVQVEGRVRGVLGPDIVGGTGR